MANTGRKATHTTGGVIFIMGDGRNKNCLTTAKEYYTTDRKIHKNIKQNLFNSTIDILPIVCYNINVIKER